jgi:hypothetical protein
MENFGVHDISVSSHTEARVLGYHSCTYQILAEGCPALGILVAIWVYRLHGFAIQDHPVMRALGVGC